VGEDRNDLRHCQMMGGALGEDPPQALAETMHRAWVAFALRGDPGWPCYDLGRRPVMRFNLTSSVVEDPYARERAVWAGVR
jgi:para-nitrobenzyl esterase